MKYKYKIERIWGGVRPGFDECKAYEDVGILASKRLAWLGFKPSSRSIRQTVGSTLFLQATPCRQRDLARPLLSAICMLLKIWLKYRYHASIVHNNIIMRYICAFPIWSSSKFYPNRISAMAPGVLGTLGYYRNPYRPNYLYQVHSSYQIRRGV